MNSVSFDESGFFNPKKRSEVGDQDLVVLRAGTEQSLPQRADGRNKKDKGWEGKERRNDLLEVTQQGGAQALH